MSMACAIFRAYSYCKKLPIVYIKLKFNWEYWNTVFVFAKSGNPVNKAIVVRASDFRVPTYIFVCRYRLFSCFP